jgi:hypothetical protein
MVPGESGKPVSRRELAVRQSLIVTRIGQAAKQLRPVAGQPRQQEAPAPAGDIDILAADPVEDGRVRHPDVEVGPDLGERLLGDAAGLDDDSAVVDLEAVDLPRGGAAADVAEPLDDQRTVAPVRQPGRG